MEIWFLFKKQKLYLGAWQNSLTNFLPVENQLNSLVYWPVGQG